MNKFPAGSTIKRRITLDNIERSYHLHLPVNYNDKISYPVLFVLHGRTVTGRFMEKLTGFSELADDEDFIMVYPDGLESQWNDGRPEVRYREYKKEAVNDVKFIKEVFIKLSSEFSIESSGFFSCGLSNGGILCYRMLFEIPELLKGIAVVGAGFPVMFQGSLLPDKRVPIMIIHGTSDPIIPFDGGEIGFREEKMGQVFGINETVKGFADKYKLNTESYLEFDHDPEDELGVMIETFSDSNGREYLISYIIKNGGHTWPGADLKLIPENDCGKTSSDINATEEIGRFFNEWR